MFFNQNNNKQIKNLEHIKNLENLKNYHIFQSTTSPNQSSNFIYKLSTLFDSHITRNIIIKQKKR